MACTTMPPETVKWFLELEKIQGHHFYSCDGCSIAFSSLNKRMTELDRDLKQVQTNVDKNTISILTTNDKVEVLEKDMETVKQAQGKGKEDIVIEATRAWSAEQRDRESRKDNLIIYGIKEVDVSVMAGHARKAMDEAELDKIFSAINADINIKEDTKFIARLGTIVTNAGAKPRPLKICLHHTDKKEMLFDKARNLPKTTYRELSFVPDLTNMQRQEDQELISEAKRLNDARTQEEALNWEHQCIGRRGVRTIARLRIDHNRPRRAPYHPAPPATAPANNPQTSDKEETSEESDVSDTEMASALGARSKRPRSPTRSPGTPSPRGQSRKSRKHRH